MITLTIDGLTVEVPEGTSLLRAAEMAGIKIPTLCDHPNVRIYGGCRLCIVEVEGFRAPVASCAMPASPGMVVATQTPALLESRRFLLSLLFSERNHFCPFCQVSGGDCELQNAAYQHEMTHWPMQPGWNMFPVDTSHEYFVLDNNRCILCRRCVRACSDLVGNFTLSIAERGPRSLLVADYDVPLGESSCVSCGACVQICPTGALMDRASAYQGQVKNLEKTASVCAGCSVGCVVQIYSRDNRLVRIEGDWQAPFNAGLLCKTGRYAPLNDHRLRITTPMIRREGALQPASWEQALEEVATHFRPLIGKAHDGVAALISTRQPAELLAYFKNLFEGQFGSQMVTSIEEGIPTALPTLYAEQVGQPFEGKLDELHNADVVVAIGVNLINTHEVVGFFLKRGLQKGLKLVVIDPYDNDLDLYASLCLKANNKDSDLSVLYGLQAALVQLNLAKSGGLSSQEAATRLATLPEDTGIERSKIEAAARMIGYAYRPVFLYGKGITAHGSLETMDALVGLARMAGVLDDEHSALISLKGEANSLAAAQYHLDKPFRMNGQQAVYLALGDDFPSQRLIRRLENAPYLAVQACYASPLTEKADVLLPGEVWAEQKGHFIRLDGRLQKSAKVIKAPDGVWANQAILASLADRLDLSVAVNWREELNQRTPVVRILEA